MARKHLLESLLGPPVLPAGNLSDAPPRVVAPTLTQGGAIGSVSRSIETLRTEAGEARTLRAKLEAGQAVIEIDPAVIDASFIADRLGYDAEEMEALVASIAEHGQQVPVLLRPHPEAQGRYQVAYGHRRVQAAQKLRRMVRAITRPLTDAELVVAQGQENNARTDLSFIERALFAARLEDAGFSRATVMSALAIDKTAASKLLAVVRRIPVDVIEAIGPAPRAGRDRWIALSERLGSNEQRRAAEMALKEPGFGELVSDARFLAVLAAVAAPRKSTSREHWIEDHGKRVARFIVEPKRSLIVFSPSQTAEFADFVSRRLPGLYQEYTRSAAGPITEKS